MPEQPLATLISLFVAGIFGLILGSKLRLPSILFFLGFGIVLGPQFLHLIDPAVFQANFTQYVSIAVALILFEGGLSLKSSQFHEISGTLKGLLTGGMAVTFILTSLAAHYAGSLPWNQALLFGSIMIVTGPTVVIPILHRLRIRENVHNVLKWEAILIDPLGVIISVVLFEILQSHGSGPVEAILFFCGRFIIGISLGAIAGWVMFTGLTNHRFLKFEGEELGGLFVLSVTLLFYGIAEWMIPETGLVAATTAGIFFGNQNFALKEHVIHFSKQITLIALSALFILLSANFPLRDLAPVMTEGLLLLFFLIFVIRPASVWVSTFRDKKFQWRDKLFIGFMAPRGIVSASLATLFAIQLEEKALNSSGHFLPLAFFVIVGSILFYALCSTFFAGLMKVREESSSGILIIGANDEALRLGDFFVKHGAPVFFVDTNPYHCKAAEEKGFRAYLGSGFDKEFLDLLDLKGVARVIAMTANDEVNYLSCQACAFYIGKDNVYRSWNGKETWEDLASPKFDEVSGRPFLVPAEPGAGKVTVPAYDRLDIITVDNSSSGQRMTRETYAKYGNRIPLAVKDSKGVRLLTPYAVIPGGSELFFVPGNDSGGDTRATPSKAPGSINKRSGETDESP